MPGQHGRVRAAIGRVNLKGSSRITGAWAPGRQAGHSSAPRTSYMPRLCHRFLHLGVSRGDLGIHPRCSDTSSAFEKESRSAAMFLLAYGRSTCAELASRVDTKVSHEGTVSWKKSRWAAWLPKPVVTAVVLAHAFPFMAMAMSRQPKRLYFVGSTPANLRDGKSLRCPPSRRVPDKWSGRRPDGYMGRAAAFPVRNAKGCLSSEGGHRRLCASLARHRRLCAVTSGPDAA
jgi:hypothetical protein